MKMRSLEISLFQIYFKTGVGGLMTGDKITKEKKKGERKTQRQFH